MYRQFGKIWCIFVVRYQLTISFSKTPGDPPSISNTFPDYLLGPLTAYGLDEQPPGLKGW